MLNLPTNSSLSVTLSQDDLRAWTTAACSASFEQDRMWLNGEERPIKSDQRLSACLKALRQLRIAKESQQQDLPSISAYNLHIASENNFPTAAGLASSAAGFAALVCAVADLFQLEESPEELSRIARQGSGSACRSLYGGYVAWEMGHELDGSDSRAVQIAPKSHWPDMKAAILVVSAQKKDVSSTSGMQHTTKTSTLFTERLKSVVPARMTGMISAIQNKDFEQFAEITMRDSNQFHAVCLDTYPPIFYMNDTSRYIVRLVEQMNQSAGRSIAAYTFDAGPNAVIYYQEKDETKVLAFIKAATGDIDGWPKNTQGMYIAHVPEDLSSWISMHVSRVILTKVGEGPQKTESSVLMENGFPNTNSNN